MPDSKAHVLYLTDTAPVPGEGGNPDVVIAAVGYVPSQTGNVNNLNSFITDPNGDVWFIDVEGEAVKVLQYSPGGFTFQNGLVKTGGIVELGGTLTKVTTVNFNGFRLHLTGGRLHVGGSNGTSRLNVESGDVELVDSGGGVVMKSSTGNIRFKMNTDVNGVLHTENQTNSFNIEFIAVIKAATKAELEALTAGDTAIPKQMYFAADEGTAGKFYFGGTDGKLHALVTTVTLNGYQVRGPYDDDELAAADGVEQGELYYVSADNPWGMGKGFVKIREFIPGDGEEWSGSDGEWISSEGGWIGGEDLTP